MKFLLAKLPQIVELEEELKHILSESEIKKNHMLLVKLFEGGWILAREIYSIQNVFKDEKTFFQALCFIKRIEVSQYDCPPQDRSTSGDNGASGNPKAHDVLIKLNENMGSPSLNFQIRSANQLDDKSIDPETVIRKNIQGSIFNDYVEKIEVIDPSKMVDIAKESTILQQASSMRKSVKITTNHSSVVSGLKCLLQETAKNLFCNISEDFFMDSNTVSSEDVVQPKKPRTAFIFFYNELYTSL